MAHHSDHRSCSPGFLRLILFLVAVFLVGYTLRLPLFWRFEGHSRVHTSCPACDCDCSSETTLSLPLGFINSSFPDCGKDDPEMNDEMSKDIISLFSEEITLQKNVATENLEHTKALITAARKTSSHYQREAEKCNVGMETCEETREKSEAAIIEERFINSSFPDCGKDDPEMNDEMSKDIISLLSEEITLQKNVATENLEHTKALITAARKTSSHYQREAEKCNVGMETCEETREKSEAAIIEERKLSVLWEQRAREYGWKDEEI